MYIYSNACDDCKITLKTPSVPVMQLTNTVMFLNRQNRDSYSGYMLSSNH